MQVRHTKRPPQTIKQAKAEFKKHGPRISSQEQRQIDRGAELYRRAEKIRESEKKRQIAKKRKQEREDRERDARRRLNIPGQKPAIARSQCLLEGFVKIVKPGANKVAPKPLDAVLEEESWTDDDIDDDELGDESMLDIVTQPQNPPESNIKVRDFAPSNPGVQLLAPSSFDDFDVDEAPPNSVVRVSPPSSYGDFEIDKEGTKPEEVWDDCFESNTQIEREIHDSPKQAETDPQPQPPFLKSFPSTQDMFLEADDLEDLGLDESIPPERSTPAITPHRDTEFERRLRPPPPRPRPPHAATTKALPMITYDPFFDDFGLSTQDLCEAVC